VAEAEPAPSGDHLPIFEAARSDWFVTEPPEPPPHRLHRQRGPGNDGDGHPAGQPAPGPPPPTPPPEMRDHPTAQPPPPAPAEPALHRPEPAREASEDAPLYRAERARLRGDTPPPYRPTPPPAPPVEEARPVPPEEPPYRPAPVAKAPPAPAPEPGERLTQAGLPRRVPRTNLAPGMVASEQAGPDPAPTGPPPGRSPEEVRSMLSSYRTGIERGRTVAGGSDRGERPPEGP
jgi:hypothetical protein